MATKEVIDNCTVIELILQKHLLQNEKQSVCLHISLKHTLSPSQNFSLTLAISLLMLSLHENLNYYHFEICFIFSISENSPLIHKTVFKKLFKKLIKHQAKVKCSYKGQISKIFITHPIIIFFCI